LKNKKKNSRGFSLIELLISVAIIVILAGTSIGGFYYFKRSSNVNIDTQKIVNSIRKTQGKSKAMREDSAWGIDISVDKLIIFKGLDFANRAQSFDESIPIKGLTNVSGKTRLFFSKLNGLPDANSIGVLTISDNDISKNIQINEEGIVSY